MTRFFVGQRVRIKYSFHWPELAGQEGRIVGRADPVWPNERGCEWNVAPDAWGSCISPSSQMPWLDVFSPNSCQLEPIIPPHEACDADFKADLDRLFERQGVAA